MNDAAQHAEDHDDNSVPGLWETARWFMHWLLAACGTPGELLARMLLTRKERRDILHWLRPVEALVRRLLVAEAAQMAESLPPARSGGARRTPLKRTAFPSAPEPGGNTAAAADREPENDADGTVSFRILERKRGRRRRTVPGPGATCGGDPRPLARRIEALRRVFDDPAPYVRRLARRLARSRREEIGRIMDACRPPPERPQGVRQRLGEASIRAAAAHALAGYRWPVDGMRLPENCPPYPAGQHPCP